QDCGLDNDNVELSVADRWIISRLQKTEAQITRALDEFRFDHAAQALYSFIWNEYCDWYLELTKPVLNSDSVSAEAKRGTRRTLLRVLETTLRLAHPMMPFITEEIWQQIAPKVGVQGDTVMLQRYPEANGAKIDEAAEKDIEWLQGVILAVRTIRAEMNIPPGKQLPLLFQKGNADDEQRAREYSGFLKAIARLESITWLNPGDEAPLAAIQLVGDMQVLIPLAGLIDKD